MSEVTAAEINEIAKGIFEAREEIDQLKLAQKEPQKRLADLQSKMLAYFEDQEQTKHHLKGFGTISQVVRMSVKVPVGENKDKFFDALSPEDYHALRTVNSASLNSWYKEKMEEAIEKGEDFELAGIEEPKAAVILSVRKGK